MFSLGQLEGHKRTARRCVASNTLKHTRPCVESKTFALQSSERNSSRFPCSFIANISTASVGGDYIYVLNGQTEAQAMKQDLHGFSFGSCCMSDRVWLVLSARRCTCHDLSSVILQCVASAWILRNRSILIEALSRAVGFLLCTASMSSANDIHKVFKLGISSLPPTW